MIFYPLKTILDAGIKEVFIVSGPEHAGHFLRLSGSGRSFNAKFTYEVQDEAGGIAQALGLAEDFADNEDVAVILGDNIFEDNFKEDIKNFESGAKIFLKEISEIGRFGVPEIKDGKIVRIEEKPANPKSNYCVTGLYIYDDKVFDIIKNLKPSSRGELEITDVNNHYISKMKMEYSIVKGFWTDAGTIESLHHAARLVRKSGNGKR